MTTTVPATGASGFGARLWSGVLACVGVVAGVAPHVLHHVGPLAGAALLAGFGGRAMFFVLGVALSAPMLLKLHRRFRTLLAPAVAVVAFAAVFTFSNVVIAPRLAGTDAPVTAREQPQGDAHHPEGASP